MSGSAEPVPARGQSYRTSLPKVTPSNPHPSTSWWVSPTFNIMLATTQHPRPTVSMITVVVGLLTMMLTVMLLTMVVGLLTMMLTVVVLMMNDGGGDDDNIVGDHGVVEKVLAVVPSAAALVTMMVFVSWLVVSENMLEALMMSVRLVWCWCGTGGGSGGGG